MPERAKSGTQPLPAEAPRRSLAADYAAIEDALAATPRGRWFLAEYARRNRTAETELLLEAIGKLETAVLKPQRQTAMAPGHVFAELVEMSEAIARTRREIAQIKPPMQFDQQLVSATEELDHIVEATEKATSDILAGAEEIQEVAWTLRERGTDIELCDKVDQRATDIYTACSFQDITGQRTGKVVRALRFIEQRINAMIEIWGVDDIAHRVDAIASGMQTYAETALREGSNLLNGPQGKDKGLKQDDVDRMLTLREQPAASGAAQEARPKRPEEPHIPGSRVAKDGGRFERPDPLTFVELEAVKRASLFG
jgi:chemotaxis regulatin CheY-phosphate phosphatase CheZ